MDEMRFDEARFEMSAEDSRMIARTAEQVVELLEPRLKRLEDKLD